MHSNGRGTGSITSLERRETMAQPRGEAAPPRLPLYLTEDEAEMLLRLCAVSPACGGLVEDELFSRIGDLMRAFRTGGPVP